MDTVEEYPTGTWSPAQVRCPPVTRELGIAWLRIIAHRVFRARDTRARRSQARSMDGQWSTGGGWRIVSTVSPAVFRVFTAVRLEEQVRSVGGRRTEPLAPLLCRFPLSWLGCGVIRRCYSWLTGCWNLSTRGLGDRRISLGNAVRC